MTAAYSAAGAGTLTATSGAACTPALPAGVTAGMALIAHVFYGGSTTAPSTPTDWTLLDGPRDMDTPGTNGRVWVYGKKAVGSDAAPAFGTQAVTTPRRARVYSFSGVLDDTISNMVGGFGWAASAAANPVNDTGVTTGADTSDYLAINLVAISENPTIGPFTGETGGDWTEAVAEFTGTTGTPDTCMQIQTAVVAPSTTINGGSVNASVANPWGVVGFYIRSEPPKTDPATIAETPAESTWTGTGTSKSTSTGGNGSGTVSWQTGDTVYVFGATAQASSTTLGTPTHAGSNLPAFAAVGAAVGSGSQCWAHTWKAVATGSGSSVISETATSSADPWGIIAWVVRGSDGTGTRASDVSAAKTVSLTRSDAHSLVFEIIADYAAGSVTLTWTPSGQTQREATQAAGLYSIGVADWPDQGSAGATSYGVSAGFDATGPLTKIALEILGTIAAGVSGAASAAFGGTFAANGIDRAVGVGVAAFGGTFTTAGHIIEPGQAAATFAGTFTAAGIDRALGAAVAAFGGTFTASGVTGSPPVQGQASAAFGGTLAASGHPTTQGAASALFGGTATAVGAPRLQGVAVATFGGTATAAGLPRIVGLAAATFGGTFTSSGVRDTHGVAVALFGGTFAAAGFAGTPPVQGQATADFGGSFTAAGVDRSVGVAAAAFGYSATAAGRPRHPGVAVATFGYTATAGGHPRVVGVAVAAFGFIAVAVSTAEPDLNPLRVTIIERSFAVTFTEAAAVTYTEPTNAFVYQEGG